MMRFHYLVDWLVSQQIDSWSQMWEATIALDGARFLNQLKLQLFSLNFKLPWVADSDKRSKRQHSLVNWSLTLRLPSWSTVASYSAASSRALSSSSIR